jgi:PAS domain S-box-containing protein
MHLHSEAEVLGKDDFEVFPKEMADKFFSDDQSVIKNGLSVFNREEYVVDEEGQKRWLLTTKVPLRDENNHIIGLVGVGKDITTRKQFDENLQNERNLLRTLIDNLPDYISIKDVEGRFIVANMAVVYQIGFHSSNELIGKSDYDLFPRELADQYYIDEQKIIQSGQGLFEYEGPTIDKSKKEKDRWVTTIKVPLRDAQGKIISTVSISRDITERKKAEAEREKLITELQDALADVKLLSGLVPICANCKKIRDDQGYWTQIESYIQDRSDAKFSHSICPDCAAKLYPRYLTKK